MSQLKITCPNCNETFSADEVLQKHLKEKEKNTEDIWSSITINNGSVQHLDFLNEHEKLVFKTSTKSFINKINEFNIYSNKKVSFKT